MPNKPTKTDADRLRDADTIIRQKNTRILGLERELKAIHQVNDSADNLRKEIYGLSEIDPEPPKWVIDAGKIKRSVSVPLALWSDWHWGETVDQQQVGGVNKFNRAIAKQRVQFLVKIMLDLTLNHMVRPDYPGIVVAGLGDFITGLLHEDLRETNDGPIQVSVMEVEAALIWALSILADKFGKVWFIGVVGNHGRTTLKPRAKNRPFDSYEWNIYQHLERHFRNDPRLKFFIPNEVDAHFIILGHRFLASHGDTLGVKGGDGIIGALGPITRGAIKVGRSEAQIGRDFDTLLIGHYHVRIPRGEAVPVMANGCLIGYNEYAKTQLRASYTRPTQSLAFINAKHGFTAEWPMYLDNKRQAAESAQWVTWQQQKDTTETRFSL